MGNRGAQQRRQLVCTPVTYTSTHLQDGQRKSAGLARPSLRQPNHILVCTRVDGGV